MAAPMVSNVRFRWSRVFDAQRLVKEDALLRWGNIHCTSFTRCNSTNRHLTNVDYCVNLVKGRGQVTFVWYGPGSRKCDHESYLCTLLYPEEYRSSAFALRALNVELTQVLELTSDKMRAVMRMQFWKDTINNIFQDKPPQTPVAMELHRAIQKHRLSKIWLTRLLEARGKQINLNGYRSLSHVEEFGEDTVSTLNYLLLECAGVKNMSADHAASHLGQCQSLVTLLRSVPYHASRGCLYIPIDLLIKHNVSEESIRRAEKLQNIEDVMFDLATAANTHLQTARKLKKDVPTAAYPVFSSTVICTNYLKQLQRAHFHVFDTKLQARNSMLPWQLWKQKLMRTY